MRNLVILAALLSATIVSWAGPSPDLMNSAKAQLAEAQARRIPNCFSKAECGNPWVRTRTITAGQSTIAVPVEAYNPNCNKCP